MNKHFVRHALVASLLAAPLLASAQAPAPSAPPAAAPAPAPVTPEMRAAVKDLLDAMNAHDGLAKSYQAIAQTLAPRMGEAMNREIEVTASLSPDQKQRIRQNIGPSFENAVREAQGIVADPKLVDQTMDKMIPIYASHFSLQEIKELTAFYRTPVGAKSLQGLSQAVNESMNAGAQIFAPRVQAIMDRTLQQQIAAAGPAAAAPAPAATKTPAKK